MIATALSHFSTLSHGRTNLSGDDARIYYFNRQIKDADIDSFEIVQPTDPSLHFVQLAKDKNRYYHNDNIVDQFTFEKQLRGEF